MIEVCIGSLNISLAYSFPDFSGADSFVLNLLLRDLFGLKIIFFSPSPQMSVITFFIKSEMMVKSYNHHFCIQDPMKVIADKFFRSNL